VGGLHPDLAKSLNLEFWLMSFAAVMTELEEMHRADLQRSPQERFGHILLTDDHIGRWGISAAMSRSELYDRIAIYLARGFYRSKLEFTFCDGIVNDVHAVITKADERRPELFWEVFLAFDAGEFYRNNDRSRDPVEVYTRPLIAKVVEKHSTDYPDVG
jgi:hypothetical protein